MVRGEAAFGSSATFACALYICWILDNCFHFHALSGASFRTHICEGEPQRPRFAENLSDPYVGTINYTMRFFSKLDVDQRAKALFVLPSTFFC